jgi:deoxyribodipyrimidine photo-lyase
MTQIAPTLFWHRRDLRLADNLGLAAARHYSPKVLGVFCLDPGILQQEDIAPVRVVYLLGCLQELQQRYRELGSELLILHQPPVQGIPKLATTLQVQALYWNREVEPYGQVRDRQVAEALQHQGIPVHTFWDQLLHEPESIVTGNGTPYTVYTPFWKNCRTQTPQVPAATMATGRSETIDSLESVSEQELNLAASVGATIVLPTAQDLGFHWDQPLIVQPGEQAAREQLEIFCDQALESYQEQRDFPGIAGTSQLSTALKFGAIGIRTAWTMAEGVYEQANSDEARKNIETWQKELIWREFYYHALYHFPQLAEGPYRPQWQQFPWENNEVYFEAWCEGKTGYPIVDAAMRQLNQTGWMHNRCRMIVANFLTKDLIVDWRWGEKYFMQHLIDGDLASNNGGWQWSTSSGMDSRPLRIFNPITQTQKYDPEAEYIRAWLPEIRHLETEALVTGKILPLERGDYPPMIVDHHHQQQKFKALYATLKS